MGYPKKTLRNEEIFRLMEAGETVYSLAEKIQSKCQQNLANLQLCR